MAEGRILSVSQILGTIDEYPKNWVLYRPKDEINQPINETSLLAILEPDEGLRLDEPYEIPRIASEYNMVDTIEVDAIVGLIQQLNRVKTTFDLKDFIDSLNYYIEFDAFPPLFN